MNLQITILRILVLLVFTCTSLHAASVAKETQWYVRAGTSELNGGGYDGVNYPGGLNYADSDTPILSLTDLTSTASTTVTSAAAGFTANMVGNVIRLASATGSPVADSGGSRYLVITAYTSATTVTVDKVSGTYTAGIGRVGGAHPYLWVYANGGSGGPNPALTTPLGAGNTINMRGAGSNDPSIASPDYTYPASSYWQFPSGDTTSGQIKLVGYNGRPLIKTDGLFMYQNAYWDASNIKITPTASVSYNNYGVFASWTSSKVSDIIGDQNGKDFSMIVDGGDSKISNIEIRNTGGGSAGTQAAISSPIYNSILQNIWVHGATGIGVSVTQNATIDTVIITDCLSHGMVIASVSGTLSNLRVNACTIDGNAGDGIRFSDPKGLILTEINNCILSNNGAYGLNVTSGTAAANDLFANGKIDYNNFYSNSTAARNGLNAGAHDLALDPQYVNAAADNYAVGTNMKAVGTPSVVGKSPTTSYTDMGAAQRQEAGGGSTVIGGSWTF